MLSCEFQAVRSKLYELIKRTPARYLYHRFKAWRGGSSQSDESEILLRLAADCPRTFVEFGFHPTEYNCIGLVDFSGLVLDGDPATVRLARAILPSRIQVRQEFLTLENLGFIADYYPALGVLSIDVDGNDYWFLKELLATKPYVIAIEYNASFGLAPVTVPYDPAFERHTKHPSGWYHGASLAALAKLCERHGFKLVAVAKAGGNAFFVRASSSVPGLDPNTAYRENALRNRWSKTTAAEQWARIKDMPFIEV
jgi:hypothetical protein